MNLINSHQEHVERSGIAVILYILCALLPAFVFPGIIENIYHWPKLLVLVCGSGLITAIFFSRIIFKHDLSTCLIAALFLQNVFSIFYSVNPYYAKQYAVINICGLIVLYATSQIKSRRFYITLLVSVSCGGLVVAIITLRQFLQGSPYIIGTLGNSNFLGAYLLFPLFTIVGLTIISKTKRQTGFLALCWVVVFSALVISRARAAWVGFFCGFPVLGYLVVAKLKTIPRISTGRLISGILIFICFIATIVSFKPERMHDFTNSDTLHYRFKHFAVAVELFKESPIFGHGLGAFRNQVYEVQATLEEGQPGWLDFESPQPRYVHNDYLETLCDGGLLSFLTLALLYIYVMRKSWLRINSDDKDRDLMAACFSCMIAVAICGMFFFVSRIIEGVVMISIMMGILNGLTPERRLQ